MHHLPIDLITLITFICDQSLGFIQYLECVSYLNRFVSKEIFIW
jgi:hypothetical protein